MKKRNGNIDLLKFLFALALIIYHGRKIAFNASPLFLHGYFAVEFFFIVSGFYLAKTAIEQKKDSGKFIIDKYLGFLPYHTFCFILAFGAVTVIGSYSSIKSLAKLVFASVPEYFIVPCLAGLKYNMANINGIEWYLAAMILAMAIIYPFVKKWPQTFCKVAAPLIFLFISGYLFNVNNQSYNCISDWNGFICLGVLRAIAEISIGCTIYFFTFAHKEIENSNSSKLMLTIGEILCWVIVFAFMTSNLKNKYEFSAIYFVIFGLCITFSGKSYLSGLFNNKFIFFLGKLSFPMFLNQSWTRKVLIKYNPGFSYIEAELAFIGLTVVMSILCIIIMDNIMKLLRKNKSVSK